MEDINLLPCSCGAGEEKLSMIDGHYEGYDGNVRGFVAIMCISCGKKGPKEYCVTREITRQNRYIAKQLWNNERL